MVLEKRARAMALAPAPSFLVSGWARPCVVVLAALFVTTCNRDIAGPRVPTQLVFTVQPSTTTAGGFIKPAVQVAAQDASGDMVQAFTGDINVRVMTDTGATAATVTVAAVDGVARFDALWITASGTHYTLKATANGLKGATSAPFDIEPGPPTHLGFLVEPMTTTAGAAITPALQVSARDAYGNPAPTFTSSVTVAVTAGTGPAGAALSGTRTVAALGGVATFSTLSLDKSGTGYKLTVTTPGLTPATSTPFAITAASAAHLVFTAQPPTTTANAVIAPAVQVTAQDALGNAVPEFTDAVTVTTTAGTGPGGATLAGTTTVTAVGGVATFGNLSIDKAGSSSQGTAFTLSAAAAGVAGATSDPFDILPGAAARLAFTIQPSSTRAGAYIAPPVQVTALDAVGNAVPAFTGNVTVAIRTNPAGGTLTGGTQVAAVAGVATFSALRIDKVGTGYTFAATAPGLADAASAAFNLTPGAATQLEFSVQPGTASAGATIAPAVRVTVRDALGNVATGFTGNVTVAIGTNPGSGTMSGTRTLAASSGIATFATLSIDQAGSGYTLTAAAAGLAGVVSAPFDVIPSTAAQLVFAVQPSLATAGATIGPAVEVKARDALGNLVPGFTESVTLVIGANPAGGSLSGTTTVTAVAGTATFATLSIDRSGSDYTLTASSPGVAGTTSAPFDVTAAPATQLVFTVQPSTATAGATIAPQVEVTALDGLGNTATGFNGNVTLAIGSNPGGGSLSGTTTVAAVAGVASFPNLSIDKAGNGYTVSATAVGATPVSSNAFDITAAPATHLAFAVQPSNATAGATISPAVQLVARDALGNTETAFTGTVTLTVTAGTGSAGAKLSGTRSVAAVAGVATFGSLSIDRAGGGYTLSATAAGLAGSTSSSFNITAGAATQLVLTVQPSAAVAGAAIAPALRVAARDRLGNTATGFTGTMTIAIGTNPGGGALSGTTSVAAVAGIATFSNLSIDRAGSGYTLTATAAGVTSALSAPFDVSPGVATHLVFTVQPSATTVGLSITPALEVTAHDALGNVVPGFAGSVTVAIAANPGGGTLSGTTTVAAAAGVATFSDFTIDKSGSGYTLSATSSGLAGATSAAFTIAPGAATHLVFTVQPTMATADGIIKPAVRVAARDALGNTATGFAGNVTLAIGANPAGGALSGTRTFAAIGGIATFPTLRIDIPGNGYTLTAAAVGLAGATSAAFDITPSVVTSLVVSSEPTDSQTAGVTIAPAVQVEAHDASRSLVTGFTGDVTVAIAPGTGVPGATLAGSTTVAAVGGVATFGNLSIDKSEAWYTLSFTAAGLVEPTRNAFRVFPGAATRLVFAVQPSTATAGATITPQLEVIARDVLGNTATGFNGNVTIAIGNNPVGGTLSGTTTVAATGGVAVFRGLSIAQPGNGFTLVVTAPGLTDAMSAPFDITAERASYLIFTTEPTSTTAGGIIGPAVQVTAHDALGQTATGFNGNVTLTITAGSGATGATLSGTTTVAAVNGVATFSTLSIDKRASAYRLSATATGLAGSTSSFFTINAGAPTHLTFTPSRIPGDSSAPTPAAGATIHPAISVVARDALENAVDSFTGNVTVAITTNPGGGTLSGTTTVAALAGVATFNDLSLDRSGTGYKLQATASGLSAGESNGFVVTPAAATQLVFSVQPSAAITGQSITPSVRVTAFDPLGNQATQFTGLVTIAITQGTGTGGAVLLGTTTVAAVNGVAIFSGLSVDRAGTGFALSATAGGLTAATSIPFDIN